jgi:hypothetical protein
MVMHNTKYLPSDPRDMKVWYAGKISHMTGWHRKHVPHSVTNPSTFQAFLKMKTKTEYKWMFKHTTKDMPFAELATAIIDDAAIAIIYGSHNNDWGMKSWRLLSFTSEMHQCQGLHVTPWQKC